MCFSCSYLCSCSYILLITDFEDAKICPNGTHSLNEALDTVPLKISTRMAARTFVQLMDKGNAVTGDHDGGEDNVDFHYPDDTADPTTLDKVDTWGRLATRERRDFGVPPAADADPTSAHGVAAPLPAAQAAADAGAVVAQHLGALAFALAQRRLLLIDACWAHHIRPGVRLGKLGL